MAMKSWMALTAALVLAAGLAGCGNDDGDAPPEPANETQPRVGDAAGEVTPGEGEEIAGEGEEAAGEGEEAAGEGEVDAGAETLGETPSERLDEGGALPGETTREDVDAIIEENERRFEEASREIESRFEQAERQDPELEPMDMPEGNVDLDEVLDMDTRGLPDEDSAMPLDELSESDIDRMIEENERRFEEASRRIDEQFEEAERQEPGEDAP